MNQTSLNNSLNHTQQSYQNAYEPVTNTGGYMQNQAQPVPPKKPDNSVAATEAPNSTSSGTGNVNLQAFGGMRPQQLYSQSNHAAGTGVPQPVNQQQSSQAPPPQYITNIFNTINTNSITTTNDQIYKFVGLPAHSQEPNMNMINTHQVVNQNSGVPGHASHQQNNNISHNDRRQTAQTEPSNINELPLAQL